MSCWSEILDKLDDDEEIILGGKLKESWGIGSYSEEGMFPDGWLEPEELRRQLEQYESWSGGHGSPSCPRAIVYTNKQVFFPQQYDGSTRLRRIPRINIKERCHPIMPGGG